MTVKSDSLCSCHMNTGESFTIHQRPPCQLCKSMNASPISYTHSLSTKPSCKDHLISPKKMAESSLSLCAKIGPLTKGCLHYSYMHPASTNATPRTGRRRHGASGSQFPSHGERKVSQVPICRKDQPNCRVHGSKKDGRLRATWDSPLAERGMRPMQERSYRESATVWNVNSVFTSS
jgi:hypothetical protein